ncbi:MAG: hypothetical protein CMK06_02175 [Ponticaulis sp.]|nr:hypothetical protein [Ponticaulis sp.]
MGDVMKPQRDNAALISGKRQGYVPLGDAARLAKGRLHEVTGDGTNAFALSIAAQIKGAVVWIKSFRSGEQLCPQGLSRLCDPARFIFIRTVNRLESLWAAEQALRMPGAPCVVVELQNGPDLKESRRLQIAAEATGALCLGLITGAINSSAAHTRWQCESVCDAEYQALWRLTKAKDGQRGQWRVKLPNRLGGDYAARLVSVVSQSAA